MNILLLGNGYDLNYKLPTSYRNFLLTIDFLVNNNIDNIHTVGDVFGNQNLNKQDKLIAESFEAYKEIYNIVPLDTETLQKMVDCAKTNLWFNYFIKSFNREAGWIDIEREISFVINQFQLFLGKAKVTFLASKVCDEIATKYIIMDVFNFFIAEAAESKNILPIGSRKIRPEYTIEYPLGSENHVINTEKIIGVLRDSLFNFVDILKTYLHCFINKTVENLIGDSVITQLQAFLYTDAVITFNYTNTYEFFGSNAQIFHIHGNVNDKIVLGINPDKNDNLETINTSFITFKKYFQRAYYGTDVAYLRWLRDLLDVGGRTGDIHLLVMGHSLDVTDEDIIKDLFSLASEITIIYHSDSSKAKYIRNLANIFGKEKFDRIRDEKRLEFMALAADFSEFSKKMADNSTMLYECEIERLL